MLYEESAMIDDGRDLINDYFKEWEQDIERAETLLFSDQFFLEGLLVLSCYIGALGRLRYPTEPDWHSYKSIVWEYSSLSEIYENIDLLFFYQWPRSTLANEKIYKKIKNHPELVNVFKHKFGGEPMIKSDPLRYQKRDELALLAKREGAAWFDENNFMKYVELFSNNQILYQFLRCEAVHNSSFPLFNPVYSVEQQKTTYEDNHQITREVILATAKNIVFRLGNECVKKIKWPGEL